MKHTNAQPTSIHPIPIGEWARSSKTGAVGQVVGWHIRSGCEETPAAVSWPHCEHPVWFYDLLIDGKTIFYGPDTLELTEAPMTQKNSTTQATPDSEQELATHIAKHAAMKASDQPDPWDAAAEGQPSTTAEMSDVVAAAKAETADVIEEADAAITAVVDDATHAHAQLAGAVAVINQDSDQIAALRSKRARALKTARTRGRRWHQAAASTRKARAKLATVRAELDAAQHSIANKDSIIALLQGNLNAAHLKNMELESTLINKHADEYDPTSEAAQLADDLAAARARIDELVKTVNGLRQDAERNSRRMDTTPIKATVDHAAQSDVVALRDQMTDLLSVLREYGYVAYENETRVKPEAWLRQRLANIGEPVKGGASKPAAS